MADSCIYEYVRNKVQCVAVTKIPLRSKAISCCRNHTEDQLALGCEDSSVVLYESYRQVTLIAEAEVLPSLMCCHPSGALILVGSSQGELQLFDTALSPLKMQLLAEDFSPKTTLQLGEHFDISSSLVQIQWAAPQVPSQSTVGVDVHDLLLLRFDKGPVGGLRFKTGVFPRGPLGPVEIIQEYIRQDEMFEAINLLSSMNWNTMGHQCYKNPESSFFGNDLMAISDIFISAISIKRGYRMDLELLVLVCIPCRPKHFRSAKDDLSWRQASEPSTHRRDLSRRRRCWDTGIPSADTREGSSTIC
ncbi:UNVERIFIED_CONTAM: hypothetical protein K2H54_044250 [Gekko kuhli]